MMPNEERVVIHKINFYGAREHHDQFTNPWVSTIGNTNAVDALLEATHDTKHVNPTALAGVADMIIQPSTEHSTLATIDSGWQHRRLMFHALIEVSSPSRHGSSYQYISGYTDFDGISQNGAIAPDMRLFFNSSMLFRQVIHGEGNKQLHMVENSNIIASTGYDRSHYNQHSHMVRPVDLATSLHANSIMEEDDYHNTIDMSSSVISGVSKSRVNNNHAPAYLAKVIEAFGTNRRESNAWNYHADESYSNLISYTSEPLVNRDTFLRTMCYEFDYGKFDNTSITFGNLLSVHPELTDIRRINVMRMGAENHFSLNDVISLNGNTLEQTAGRVLVSSLPSMMSDTMFIGFGFDYTNDVAPGYHATDIVTPRPEWISSFAEGVDLRPSIDALVNRIRVELGPMLTNRGMFTINLTVRMNLVGEAFIRVSINGAPAMTFNVPLWASSLMVPTIGSTAHNLRTLAHDLDGITELADEVVRAKRPAPLDERMVGIGGSAMDYPDHGHPDHINPGDYTSRGYVDPIPAPEPVMVPESGGLGLGGLPHLNF